MTNLVNSSIRWIKSPDSHNIPYAEFDLEIWESKPKIDLYFFCFIFFFISFLFSLSLLRGEMVYSFPFLDCDKYALLPLPNKPLFGLECYCHIFVLIRVKLVEQHVHVHVRVHVVSAKFIYILLELGFVCDWEWGNSYRNGIMRVGKRFKQLLVVGTFVLKLNVLAAWYPNPVPPSRITHSPCAQYTVRSESAIIIHRIDYYVILSNIPSYNTKTFFCRKMPFEKLTELLKSIAIH